MMDMHSNCYMGGYLQSLAKLNISFTFRFAVNVVRGCFTCKNMFAECT
jgi:hypothetical protein